MKRWIIAALVVVPPAVGLAGLAWRGSPSELALADEILAYEIAPTASVTVRLPGELDEMIVTTWAEIEPRPLREDDARYPYAYTVTFADRQGRVVGERTFEPETRVLVPTAKDKEFSARLVASDAWVGEARSSSVDVPAAMRGGGTARVTWRSAGQGVSAVLVRTAYREPRSKVERLAVARGLTADQMRKLDEGRTALAFSDLSPAARDAALATWGRRLDADGKEGVDYRVRRLLLGTLEPSVRVVTGVLPGMLVSKRHSAALNFGGPVHLELSMPESGEITVTDGDGKPLRLDRAVEQRVLRLADERTTPRTIVVESTADRDVRVHAYAPKAEENAQIREIRPRADATTIAVEPDVRTLRAVRLDRTRPVAVRIAPGQKHLRVVVRGQLGEDDPRDALQGKVELSWLGLDGARRSAAMQVDLRRSKFDRWKGHADATEPASATLGVPRGVTEVQVVGDEHLAASFFVEDRLVTEDVLRMPYRVSLAPKEAWRNAPYDIRAFSPIQPSNSDELEREKRLLELAGQVRIVRGGAGAGAAVLQEALLEPQGTPVARRFLQRASLSAGVTAAEDTWTELRGARQVVVPASGRGAGRLTVAYVAGAEELGNEVRLVVDGAKVATRRLVTRSGALSVDAPAGAHSVFAEGLGPRGFALASAPPAGGGEIVRRRVVYELVRGSSLTFPFVQPAGKSVGVALEVVTDVPEQDFTLLYRIDNPGGERVGELFRTLTVPVGTVSGRTGDAGRGIFWDGDAALSGPWTHGFSKAKIRVGDDRAGQARALTLNLGGTLEHVFVCAVLIGGSDTPRTDSRRWLAEDEDNP